MVASWTRYKDLCVKPNKARFPFMGVLNEKTPQFRLDLKAASLNGATFYFWQTKMHQLTENRKSPNQWCVNAKKGELTTKETSLRNLF